jgi:hypothetical protein
MARNWAANVKRYVPHADEAAINGIVRHLGMALQSRDGTFIACGDHNERERVRDNFLKHKLGVTESDAELDRAVMDTCRKMKAERDKLRVTFYYLLAERYGKLALFTSATGQIERLVISGKVEAQIQVKP